LFGAWNFGGDAAFTQVLHDFNTAAKALPMGAPLDGFVDVWSIPGLNKGTTTVATSLSPDNNHLMQAGHILVEPYYRAVVNQVWSR